MNVDTVTREKFDVKLADLRFDHENKTGWCLRFWNEEKEHIASFVPCAVNSDGTVQCWDFADPNGKVLMCSVDNETVQVMADAFGGLEKFKVY